MNDNARKAGDYEIIHAVHVGEKEVVVGELPYDSPQKYMCAMYEENDIAGQYFNCMVGDSYPEAMILFAERVKSQAEKAQERLENLNVPSEDKKEFDYNKA
ncbi:MAG: hypothetical protein KBT46_03005, partial [Ruminococcus sp.]|nr:hypothetical protein [Candidatus Copronaster equi]